MALSGHGDHPAARDWMNTVDGASTILFCRATQQTLLRLLTNRTVLGAYGNSPLSNAEAWSVYEAFVGDDRIAFRPDEPAGLESQWKSYAVRESASPKLWMDAYLAAFAAIEGYRLVTTDADFKQFGGLNLLLLS